MKKVICYLSVFLITVCFYSCSSDNELLYSCDPEADEWVKENFTDVQEMSYTEFKEIPFVYQQASFGAFIPEKRAFFVMSKIEEILELDWSVEERVHILKMKDLINDNPQMYSNADWSEDDELLNKVELFLYKWTEEALENFGWDEQVIYAINAVGQRMLNKEGLLQERNLSDIGYLSNTKSSVEVSCSCNAANDCPNDPGGWVVYLCKETDSKCAKINWGCSPFGLSSCSYGRCYHILAGWS